MGHSTVPCESCGEPIPPSSAACPKCGFDRLAHPDPPASPPMHRGVCTACGGETTVGSIDLRTGGHSGTAVFLFGGIAEAGEETLTLGTRTCRICGHIDLYRR